MNQHPMDMQEIDTPVVAICGGSGRLGQHLVAGYAKAGYRVVSMDRSIPEREDTGVTALQVNSLDEEAVRKAFESIMSQHGRLDTVIQTVGMWGMAPLVETSLNAWTQMMDVNLTSTFLCFREAARVMHGKSGRLIGITSQQGADRGVSQQAGYSAAKAGVMRLVESVAAEYAGQGLTAHALAPSTILYGDESSVGVRVEDLVSMCLYLSGPGGAALSGSVIRAFGR